jgi:hypothetical protein
MRGGESNEGLQDLYELPFGICRQFTVNTVFSGYAFALLCKKKFPRETIFLIFDCALVTS